MKEIIEGRLRYYYRSPIGDWILKVGDETEFIWIRGLMARFENEKVRITVEVIDD